MSQAHICDQAILDQIAHQKYRISEIDRYLEAVSPHGRAAAGLTESRRDASEELERLETKLASSR